MRQFLLAAALALLAAPPAGAQVIANQTNLVQIRGKIVSVGAGASDAGTQRVVLSSDSHVLQSGSFTVTPGTNSPTEQTQVAISTNIESIREKTDQIAVDRYGRVPVAFQRGNQDLFNRIRVQYPVAIFESQSEYGLSPYLWTSSTTAGASVVSVSSESSSQLSVGTGNGQFAVSQTRVYHRYNPGKSLLIVLTGSFQPAKQGVVSKIGYFDEYNGAYVQVSSAGLQMVLRSTATGTFTETIVSSSAFNLDKLDGTGPSGYAIDPSSSNLYFVEIQWLGVGGVRVGVFNNGEMIPAHIFTENNKRLSTFMSTANLPVRYSIRNVTATASPSSMRQICSAVFSEGGYTDEITGVEFSTASLTSFNVNARRPILSIRLKTAFGGKTNRGQVRAKKFQVFVNGAPDLLYELIQGGTLTGASFVGVDANSIVEADMSATAISGGRVIDTGFMNGGASASTYQVNNQNLVPLVLSYDGSASDVITVVGTSLTAGTATRASIQWEEIR